MEEDDGYGSEVVIRCEKIDEVTMAFAWVLRQGIAIISISIKHCIV